MNSIIKGLKCFGGCCGLFVLEKKSQIFAINDFFTRNFVISKLLVISNIDSYDISHNGIYLCLIYKKLLLVKN